MKRWCQRAEVSVCFCRVTEILWEWRKGPMGWCEGRDQQPGPNVTEDESGKGNADSGRRACFSWSFTYFNICEEILTMQKKPELITSSQTISRSILDPLLYSGLPTTPTLILKPPAVYVRTWVSRESADSCTHKVAVGTLTPQQQQQWTVAQRSPRPASALCHNSVLRQGWRSETHNSNGMTRSFLRRYALYHMFERRGWQEMRRERIRNDKKQHDTNRGCSGSSGNTLVSKCKRNNTWGCVFMADYAATGKK